MALAMPLGSAGHVFVAPYTLPVPFALYAGAATATLVVSFLMVAAFTIGSARTAWHGSDPAHVSRPGAHATGGRWVMLGRALAFGALLLTIATALFGSRNPFLNFGMTAFWIAFVLAVPYVTAVTGDVFAAINPWKTLVHMLARGPLVFRPRVALPPGLAHVPALILYTGFIWLELFGQLRPFGLGVALLVYTSINVAGAWLLGIDSWFEHGEFFGLFLRLIGRMGVRGEDGSWRLPCNGLLDERVRDLGLVLFIIAMLASTAFDGLHGTAPFAALFWKHVYPMLATLFPAPAARLYAWAAQMYYFWQWFLLAAFPFLYLAALASAAALSRWMSGTVVTSRTLVCDFCVSLVPIAVAYHAAHYFTLLPAQGGQMLALLSDPFGWGWDLWGTGKAVIEPIILDAEVVWHTQVGLILLGHVAGVQVAHRVALRSAASSRRAAIGQLPFLVLMVLLTVTGLWILSLPLAPGGAG